jgi:hypothetical protein
MSNVIFAWGSAPTKSVLAETKMVTDFFKTLGDRFSRQDLSVEFPQVLDRLVATAADENWELFKSNNIQPCKIFYEHNKVNFQESLGVIFVHTHCRNKFADLTGDEAQAKFEE